MASLGRSVALGYSAIVLLVAAWAWWVNVRMLHSPQEHLLPGILLAIVSTPTSLSLDLLYDHWPNFFSGLMQLVWLTICGGIQVIFLFILLARPAKPRREA